MLLSSVGIEFAKHIENLILFLKRKNARFKYFFVESKV